MNDYLGKICPYCKTEFRPGDDIVVCSQCDMPHHKDCWVENQGCTTFGCLGTIQTADRAASSVTATQMQYEDTGSGIAAPAVFCTRCGAQNKASSSFCTRCGHPLKATANPAPQPHGYAQADPANTNPYAYTQNAQSQAQNGYSGYHAWQPPQDAGVDAELSQLVGTNTEYYMPKFQALRSSGSSASWNWAAFLAAPYWMIYRKMYGYGAAALAIDVLIGFLNTTFLSFLALAGYIAVGILGNSIYIKYLEGKANQAKAMNEPYKSQFITYNSGVNTTATILTVLGRILIVGMLLM